MGGNKKIWERNCPKCGKILTYTDKANCAKAFKKGTRCLSCSHKFLNYDNENFKRNCPKCGKELKYSSYNTWWISNNSNLPCHSCSKKGYVWSEESRQKLSKSITGKTNPNYGNKWTKEQRAVISKLNTGNKHCVGRKLSDESKMKMRQSKLKWLKTHKYKVGYNEEACKYFDKLSKDMGWNLKHVINKGEKEVLGYSVDAYDHDKNIVVEYDERHHYVNGKLRPRDIKRMERIIQKLKCQFYRYNEKLGMLEKYA